MGKVKAQGKAYGKIFQRYEKKYMINEEQRQKLMEKIQDYIEPDAFPHSDISNIYYDTDDSELIRRSLDKPKYKEKLRLRTYGTATLDGPAFIEIKKKYAGIVYKRRVMMTLREAKEYLNEGKKSGKSGQILSELDYFMNFYEPKPRLFLYYERDSYKGVEDAEVRITFDTNIQSRRENLALEQNLPGEVLLEKGMYIMEIKVPQAYPMWLTKALAELHIYPTSFSKYGTVYRKEKGEELCLQV